MVLAKIGHVRFNTIYSKHRYCRCLLIKICRPQRIVFTFHENLSDETLPEIEGAFLFFWNLKPLVTCNKMNHKFAKFLFAWYLLTDAWLGTRTFHFPVNLKLDLENRIPNKPSSEKWSSECATFEWVANWSKLSNFSAL